MSDAGGGPVQQGEHPRPRRVQPSWRQHTLTRADEIEDLTRHCARAGADPEFVKAVLRLLDEARALLTGWRRMVARAGGSDVEQAMARLAAAEAHLLRIADDEYLNGEAASILKHVTRHLSVDDPRRLRVQDIVNANPAGPFPAEAKEALIAAFRGASSESAREIMRVRSFRNVIVVAAVMLTAVAVALGLFAAAYPTKFPLCFAVAEAGAAPGTEAPQPKLVCPSGETNISRGDQDAAVEAATTVGDVATIELLGVIAAAVAAAASLRGIRGTSTPFSVPVALAVLKLPTGALTAVLGILLMRAEFLPGLSALDSSAQILGWAVVFGYAQQLFTGVVDAQAGRVLNDVRGGLTRSST